jgi:hypothetical protein
MTEEQIRCIKHLEKLKSKIQICPDAEAIGYLILATIQSLKEIKPVTADLPEYVNQPFNDINNTLIDGLLSIVNNIQKGTYADINDSKFQISTSIVQLMINLSGTGIDEINSVLETV